MRLQKALRIEDRICMAVVGAGGKTTFMFRLARQIKPPVIITTTTHLGVGQRLFADSHYIIDSARDLKQIDMQMSGDVILLTGSKAIENRLSGPSMDILDQIKDFAEEKNLSLIIEADGSRMHPLKAPASHEPVIPNWVDSVVNVAGLSGIGKPLSDDYVHRTDKFVDLSGLNLMDPITPDGLCKVLSSPQGGLKNIPDHARRIAFLNQAETQDPKIIEEMASRLNQNYDSVLIGHLMDVQIEDEICGVYEPTAGIVLAAGGSTRMGFPKILLDWNGEPLLRVVVKKAIQSKLTPVIVVTGSLKQEVRKILIDLPVVVVDNKNWEKGQSTSIIRGIINLPENTGSAIFLLADQPQISPDLITELIKKHSKSLNPIICPRVGEKRANPVLFDRVTFFDMSTLTGDNGGRQLFDRYPIEWLNWNDETILLDIDTKADYDRLRKII